MLNQSRRRSSRRGGLTEARPRANYTTAEREFACLLRQRLEDLLEGKRTRLEVLRKYPNDPLRLGVMLPPRADPRGQLRLATVERLTWNVLHMVAVETTGGPVAQASAPNDGILEIQTFPTKYPHIVIERVDHFAHGGTAAESITWSLRRVSDERTQTHIGRLVKATLVLLEFVRFIC